MILRAVDLAEGQKVQRLPLLDRLDDWKSTGLAPVHGGLNDQPAVLLYQGRYLQAVYRIMHEWRHNKDYRPVGSDAKLFQHILKLIERRKSDQRARIE